DCCVDGVEVVARVVQDVERFEREAFACKVVDHRMARRAYVSSWNAFDRVARRGQEQVDTGGPEPDDDDTRFAHVVGVVDLGGGSRVCRGFGACGGATCETCWFWLHGDCGACTHFPNCGLTHTCTELIASTSVQFAACCALCASV